MFCADAGLATMASAITASNTSPKRFMTLPSGGKGGSDVTSKLAPLLEKPLQKSIVRGRSASGYYTYDVGRDLEEPPRHLDVFGVPGTANLHNSLPQKRHKRRVPWEYADQAVVGGRHDGIGLAIEYRTLRRDHR